ncbi:MAG TPA: type II secretion system protein GspI [Porticoccaceae bacterium]|nr:type II secretion system minor pseudopilin GspI [Porticoccaceae bacterium]HIG68114.1 type II secretion system protein GspI [Porticoccaceae bacterium]HIK79763.1 type II secretion system protein GspI [Porticoccaceae bacterium]
MKYSTKEKGFTLIEVMVALFILSLVLGSAVQMVHQYSDERLRIRERFFANQVAWNHLFERYQHSQKWTASAGLPNLKTKGVDKQAGQDWRWEMKVEKAMGQDLYRYQAQSGSVNSKNYQATLAVYLVEN